MSLWTPIESNSVDLSPQLQTQTLNVVDKDSDIILEPYTPRKYVGVSHPLAEMVRNRRTEFSQQIYEIAIMKSLEPKSIQRSSMASLSARTPTRPVTPSQLCSNDACSVCRNRGHLAEDCPFKTPQKSQTPKSISSSSSSSPKLNFPPLSCPKGHGPCFIGVSGTPKNPGKPFYACNFFSSSVKCNFFKWCNEVTNFEPQTNNNNNNNIKRDRTQEYPECRCLAGKCKMILENGLQYYVCPITKGHGACSFRKAVIDDAETSMIVNSDFNTPVGQTTSPMSPKRSKLGSTIADDPDPGPCLPYKDAGANMLESRELVEFAVEKELRVCRPPVEVVRHRQTEFLSQILAEDPPPQFLGTLISGWLGHLAFPPSESPIVSQPKPFFCCVFPSVDPIYVPKGVTDFNPTEEISTHNSQSLGVLSELSTSQKEGDFTRQISKYLLEASLAIQNQLLATLESMEPSNHRSMEDAAREAFAVLDRLSVDHSSLVERVKEFISRSKSFSDIEESMKSKQSSPSCSLREEIMERYESQRAEFLDISRIHSETVDAVAESNRRLKLLGDKASLVKEMLLRIESQLREFEAEHEELMTREGYLSEELVQSERKFRESEAEMKLHDEMETKRKAALEELQSVKDQLRNTRSVSI